jgi:predicted amidohydrolase
VSEPTLNVAVAQTPGTLTGPEERFAWLGELAASTADSDTDLLVLPELFLSGYNIGGSVTDWSEPANGDYANQISQLAAEAELAIFYGFPESDGDQLFNSAACVGKDGTRFGSHRKLLLPPGFESDHFAAGTECETFQLGGFTVAVLVCYDAEFPETFRHVAGAGADLVLVPTALGSQWSVVSDKLIPTRAFENGVFVCYANHCGTENGLTYYGGSCIVGPDGADLARAGSGPEVLRAELERGAVAQAQARLPYLIDRKKLNWP